MIPDRCHREVVQVISRDGRVRPDLSTDDDCGTTPSSDSGSLELHGQPFTMQSENGPSTHMNLRSASQISSASRSVDVNTGTDADLSISDFSSSEPGPRLANDNAATVEFLADGHRGVLENLSGLRSDLPHATSSSISAAFNAQRLTFDASPVQWDPIFSPEEARMLLVVHQDRIAWMHNVVHMPSFLQSFDANLASRYCEKSWLALYYAMILVG
jgi:hypothetical protein